MTTNFGVKLFTQPLFIALASRNGLNDGNSDFKNIKWKRFLDTIYKFGYIWSSNLGYYEVTFGTTAKNWLSRRVSQQILDRFNF